MHVECPLSCHCKRNENNVSCTALALSTILHDIDTGNCHWVTLEYTGEKNF